MKKIMEKIMKKRKNINQLVLPIAIIIAGLIIAGGIYQVGKKNVKGALSPEDAAQKAMNFISNVALNGQVPVSLLDVYEESGLYKINIMVGSDEYESYVTKDAKLLFPQATVIEDNTIISSDDFPKSDIPEVQLFVMSYCPYGNEAEELMISVDELLKGKANIKLHYVIYNNYSGGGPNYCLDKENKYCSLHGIQELNQGVRELCVQKYQKDKLWDFIKAVNTGCTYQNVDSCWEEIAQKTGVNIEQVKTCYDDEALDILAKEVELNDKYKIQGSPTLIINEKEYQGTRSSEGYKQGICSAFNSAPDECSGTLGDGGGSVSGECE